MKGAHAMTA